MNTTSIDQNKLYRKINFHIIPLIFVSYIFAYLDRVNVGFAKLQMLADLKFSETVYGLGAGIFFAGYVLFEIPSNIALTKLGTRVWISRIMISWGVISLAMMFTSSTTTFYILRFLLGVAEAGFFPGIVYYIALWYPESTRGKTYTRFMAAIAVSGIIGGPLSGFILQYMHSIAGLTGWQWLFIIEGVPSIVMGVIFFFYCIDDINKATWLTNEEKEYLLSEIYEGKQIKADRVSWQEIFRTPGIIKLALIYFGFGIAIYGLGFWLPTIIKLQEGISSNFKVGLLTAIPYLTAALAMYILGYTSDYFNERRYHLAITALASALALLGSIFTVHNLVIEMLLLSVATAGVLTVIALFWSLATIYSRGNSMAVIIAFINSVGNIAGFLSPLIIGFLKDKTGGIESGICFIAFMLLLSSLFVLRIKHSGSS